MEKIHVLYSDRYKSKVYISNFLLWPIVHIGQKLCHQVKFMKNHVYTSEGTVLMQSHETLPECLFLWNLGQNQNRGMSGQKLGHEVKS